MSSYPFIQAKHTGGHRGTPTCVVIHTAETAETPTTAEGVANYFKNGSGGRKASAHYCTDSDSTVQCVRDDVIAYAAPPLNEGALHIEMAGRAAQTDAEWRDPYSTAVILRTASLTADLCIEHSIFPRPRSAAELKQDVRGITTHAAVSAAFKKSTHTDPGAAFPWQDFLTIVQGLYVARLNPTPAPSAPPVVLPQQPPEPAAPQAPAPRQLPARPVLRRGDTGRLVGLLQFELFRVAPPLSTPDGIFGPETEAKIKGIQRLCGLEQDGIAGAKTWAAIDFLYLAKFGDLPQ